MEDLLGRLAMCVERGKVDKNSPYPPDLKGEEGADELTAQALDMGVPPGDILSKGLIVGMGAIGEKFGANKAFVPDILMAAKAMKAAMKHLKPYFESGEARHVGDFVIGTVQGDLHDIGKNLVAMMLEGGGWNVVDLGVDVSPDDFAEAVKQHPNCVVGMSALLTTTMAGMAKTIQRVREIKPDAKVIVGGAPLTSEFAQQIGADAYAADPQGALRWLNAHCAAQSA